MFPSCEPLKETLPPFFEQLKTFSISYSVICLLDPACFLLVVQTRFSFCAVTMSDIPRQSGPTAPGLLLCAAISSAHLLTAGCLQA